MVPLLLRFFQTGMRGDIPAATRLGGKEDTYGVLVSSTVCEMLEASPGDFVVFGLCGG